MRKTTLVLFIIFAAVGLHCYRLVRSPLAPLPADAAAAASAQQPAPAAPEPARPKPPDARAGEEIVYNISFGGFVVGEARFACLTNTSLNGVDVNVMTFKTDAPRFADTETIYSDPGSHLPFRVERDILQWPFREKIVEVYDQKNFTVTITKDPGSTHTITRDRPIHNAILLPYFLRRMDNLGEGWKMAVTFPTHQFLVTLVSVDDLEVPAGTFKAYHFRSDPFKFEIWITADERKIPVKIQGLDLFGYTLAMKEYN